MDKRFKWYMYCREKQIVSMEDSFSETNDEEDPKSLYPRYYN